MALTISHVKGKIARDFEIEESFGFARDIPST